MLAYDCGSDQVRLWGSDGGAKRAVRRFARNADLLQDGGAKRDRTADLLRARQALSQLSYGPG